MNAKEVSFLAEAAYDAGVVDGLKSAIIALQRPNDKTMIFTILSAELAKRTAIALISSKKAGIE